VCCRFGGAELGDFFGRAGSMLAFRGDLAGADRGSAPIGSNRGFPPFFGPASSHVAASTVAALGYAVGKAAKKVCRRQIARLATGAGHGAPLAQLAGAGADRRGGVAPLSRAAHVPDAPRARGDQIRKNFRASPSCLESHPGLRAGEVPSAATGSGVRDARRSAILTPDGAQFGRAVTGLGDAGDHDVPLDAGKAEGVTLPRLVVNSLKYPGGASGTARKAPSGWLLGHPTRNSVRAPCSKGAADQFAAPICLGGIAC
jgi:hypothetical protein